MCATRPATACEARGTITPSIATVHSYPRGSSKSTVVEFLVPVTAVALAHKRGVSPPNGAPLLAVCLTGQLRWHTLTLANLQQFVLARLPSAHRLYFIGPGERHGPAEQSLRLLGAEPQDICAYNPQLTWAWGSGSMGVPVEPFEMHGSGFCTDFRRSRARQVVFNLRWLPIFRRCIAQKKGSLSQVPLPGNMDGPPCSRAHLGGVPVGRCTTQYNASRAQPCPSAVSLIVQLWQAQQSLALVRAAEQRLFIRHDAVLRIRPDIFFFKPVDLPRPAVGQTTWYSMLEESCRIHEGWEEATYGLKHQRFLQDFWLYGSRDVMEVALEQPLTRLLTFGRDAAAFMACATCHKRPASIAPRRMIGESCCRRQRKNTPKYALHPLPDTLVHVFNESQHCLTFNDAYGLIRANPAESCFMVQARMAIPARTKRGVGLVRHKWGEVDLSRGVPRRLKLHGQHEDLSVPFLKDLAALYERCFGLASNTSCPRTVGDHKLWSGAEAACFRSQTAACASQDDIAPGGVGGRTGFECAAAGIAKLVGSFRKGAQ